MSYLIYIRSYFRFTSGFSGTFLLFALTNTDEGGDPFVGNGKADEELVASGKMGNDEAFEVLVIRHEKRVFNIVLRLVGDYNEAAEVTQDVFVSAWRGLKGFKGNAKFTTWLCSIAVNLSRNRQRQMITRERRHTDLNDNPTGGIAEAASVRPEALENLQQEELRAQVLKCIKTLDTSHREVIVLRDIQGFTYGEIVVALNVAEGTVKSRLSRARKQMRECLGFRHLTEAP